MKNLPPLPALRAFEAVARLGSVVQAADELHVTHGAVSQQVRALETHLGLALFTRHGRRLSLTEDGRIYEYTRSFIRGDRGRLDVHMQKSGMNFVRTID